MMPSFVDQLSAFARSLSEQEREGFQGPLHWVMLANGDADFHDNVIFFGFAHNDNDPVLVVKVPRLVENGWMLKVEYDHLVDLWQCIGEQAGQYVPRPYAMPTLNERPVLVTSYVAGESLTRLSPRSFWMQDARVAELAREAARVLREMNQLTARPIGADPAPADHFQEKAQKFRDLFRLTTEEDRALSDLAAMIEAAAAHATHKVIIQGDFWHGNMIRTPSDGKLRLVDWQFARWAADVSMDVYFFLLAGALSASERGPAEQRAKYAYDLLSQWRARVIPDYLCAYGEPECYGLLPQKQGMLLCCVEKAVRPALEFGYTHADDLLWRHLYGQLVHW